MSERIFDNRRWLIGVLISHSVLIVVGLATQAWLMTVFCLWIRPQWIQTALALVWLVLTLSPLIGISALKFESVRRPYFLLAAATPLFFILVAILNEAKILVCDAP